MPAACGVALATGGPVLCVVGDGSTMYSPQSLWTAAREALPVVFAVVDNGQYLILKQNLRAMGGASAETGQFVAMDLDRPSVDFCALAGSMGVPRHGRAHGGRPCEDSPSVAAGGPHLLHIPITAR